MNNNQSQNDKYQSVQVTQPNFNRFNLSCHHATTIDYFRLQPIYTRDMVPGDTFNVNIDALVQASPFVQQVFGGYHMDIDFFFVPNRILYKDWDNFITDTTDNYTPPYISMSDLLANRSNVEKNIFSSIGYPMRANYKVLLDNNVSRLPARAYQRIWWDYYRDSLNILERDKSAYLNTDGGNNGTYDFIPRYRCFQKDYISTLLTSPQFGNQSAAEVNNVGWSQQSYKDTDSIFGNGQIPALINGNHSQMQWLQNVSIPALRAANAMQRYLERLGVGGSRVTERILSIFGQQTTPERLDMAEYCGRKVIRCGVDGNSVNNNGVDSVAIGHTDPFGAEMANSDGEYALGSSFGTSKNRGMSDTISYHALEHGIFMAVASIVPDITPLSGIDRMFLRGIPSSVRIDAKRLDYYTPDFDGLGYQEVFLREVVQPTSNSLPSWQSEPFSLSQIVGYQPKFEDYRIGRNLISGDFLNPTTMDGYKNMLFFRDLTAELDPNDVVAGLNLTTASEATRAEFDNKHQITSTDYDHFILDLTIVNDATRPMSGNELPTELANLANKTLQDVSYGGVRL